MKKFLVYAGVCIAILLLLYFGVSLSILYSTQSRVEARRQAITDAGDPLYLTDYETDPIPDEENAYVHFMRAAPDLEAFERELDALPDYDLQRQLTAEQIDAFSALVEKHEPLYAQLEQAAACEQYQLKGKLADGVSLNVPHVMHFRTAAHAFSMKALVAAYQDKGDDALVQCATSLRLTNNLQDEPILISHLVNLACQAIAVETSNHTLRVANTTPEACQKLDAVLSDIDNRQATIDAMKGERAMGVMTFQQMRDGTLNPDDFGESGASRVGLFGSTWLGQAYLNDDEAKYIELLNQQIAAAELSKNERERKLQPVWDELEQSQFRHLFSRLLAPALDMAVDVSDRQDAKLRCLRVLLAIADSDVEELEELDLPDNAKIDPIDGQPLRIVKQEDGLLVYSIGENLIDDGGDIYHASGAAADEGLGPLLPSQELPDVVEP